MYSSNVLMNELSCKKVSDLASAPADRGPIAALIVPSPASFRNPRRDVTSIPRTPCRPVPEIRWVRRFYSPHPVAASRYPAGLEQGPVADDCQRRNPVGPAVARNFPTGRPAAAFEDPGERELLGGVAHGLAGPCGPSSPQHHRHCPPFGN